MTNKYNNWLSHLTYLSNALGQRFVLVFRIEKGV